MQLEYPDGARIPSYIQKRKSAFAASNPRFTPKQGGKAPGSIKKNGFYVDWDDQGNLVDAASGALLMESESGVLSSPLADHEISQECDPQEEQEQEAKVFLSLDCSLPLVQPRPLAPLANSSRAWRAHRHMTPSKRETFVYFRLLILLGIGPTRVTHGAASHFGGSDAALGIRPLERASVRLAEHSGQLCPA